MLGASLCSTSIGKAWIKEESFDKSPPFEFSKSIERLGHSDMNTNALELVVFVTIPKIWSHLFHLHKRKDVTAHRMSLTACPSKTSGSRDL